MEVLELGCVSPVARAPGEEEVLFRVRRDLAAAPLLPTRGARQVRNRAAHPALYSCRQGPCCRQCSLQELEYENNIISVN